MKRFLTALLTAVPLLSLGQSNYQKGYVVLNSKDTLRGYVDFKERRKNPVSIDFKIAPNDSRQVFTLANCTAYGIDDHEHYQRFAVNVSLSEIEIANLSIGPDLSFKRDTVFLKVLQSGKNLTLFSYVDELKERFYMMGPDQQEPLELIRNLYLQEDRTSAVVKDNKYARQLLIEMKKRKPEDQVLEKMLLRLDYRSGDLLRAVSLINGQQLPKPKHKSTRFFAGLGAAASMASYGGTHPLSTPKATCKTSFSPMLTTGVDLFVKPEIGRLIFRTELSALMSKNEISLPADERGFIVERHSFDQVHLVLTPQLIYNIYNTNKLKCFGGLGGGLNFSTTSNNKSVYLNTISMQQRIGENEVIMEKFNYSLQFMAGVVLNKKLEIAAGYSPNAAITNYSFFNIEMKRFKLGVNYLFGKH
ncbi:hypothetical protein ABIE26_004387 [Pedobacter africanus]|uniref:Uncharacterized protein n=1 Tax=Pedobacter africanus TaxID=151894 RepID=A0ACC6L2S5_9SPHI|nr:hypothetical protein [Pedobacter africanus]MDR6785677.1 hypothetical protein [Pedobacter africanus]